MSSFVTRRSVDRRNRVIFFILGLILLALGIAGLLIQAEILTRYADIESPGYYYRVIRELAQDYPGWAIAAFIVLGLLLFLIGLSWIRGQMATPSARVREVTLQNEPQGTTVVDADVISNAVARDLERMPDVHDASARLVKAGPRPKVSVRATVDGGANLSQLRSQMEQAYGRLRQVLGSEAIETDLHVKPVPSRRSRVS